MSFFFKQYGTFTGPNSLTGDYNYDLLSQELEWPINLPIDTSFKLTDVAVVLYNLPGDYVGHYLLGSCTSLLNLGKSTGPIPAVINTVVTTVTNGNTITNGNVIVNGTETINGATNINGILNVTGTITGPKASYWDSKKSFDIPHPSKENHRLRYICLEGPEAEVYLRGKLINSNVIELPEYWRNLVDVETIGVTLTPIGFYQELFVEKIEWGNRIIIKNNTGADVNCTYVVYGERKDTSKNIPEYEGNSPEDYPGDNREYVINGNGYKNK